MTRPPRRGRSQAAPTWPGCAPGPPQNDLGRPDSVEGGCCCWWDLPTASLLPPPRHIRDTLGILRPGGDLVSPLIPQIWARDTSRVGDPAQRGTGATRGSGCWVRVGPEAAWPGRAPARDTSTATRRRGPALKLAARQPGDCERAETAHVGGGCSVVYYFVWDDQLPHSRTTPRLRALFHSLRRGLCTVRSLYCLHYRFRWPYRGVAGVQLPERSRCTTKQRYSRERRSPSETAPRRCRLHVTGH